jgi:hypothetical protein
MRWKTPQSAPWQALETEAYHAFREWPIWLALREKELAAHLGTGTASDRQAGAASDEAPPQPLNTKFTQRKV